MKEEDTKLKEIALPWQEDGQHNQRRTDPG